jgi:hypothetical protein
MNLPSNKKECFAQLDDMLSEADKRAIAEAEDIYEFHFTLGLWIRNNWLYDRSEEELESLSKAFGIDIPFFEADELSSEILEAYKKYLKRNK